MPRSMRLLLVLFFFRFARSSSYDDLHLKVQDLEKYLLQRISNLEGVVTEQKNEIANLKQEVVVLRLQANSNAKETSKLREILLRNKEILLSKTKETSPSRVARFGPRTLPDRKVDTMRERRLLLNSGGGGSKIAFYAYMSANEPIQKHKTLIFDVIKSNFGHGYNNFTGTFTATTSGVYVLTFTVHPEASGYASVQLVVNQEVEGVVFVDSSSADSDMTGVTSIVVVWMNQGDVSFVRTHPTYASTGSLYSTNLARCSYAGWLLSE